MKIPEATANVGAYYGNDENGQWQPNGVIIDSGVGGGIVGSGDAGIHRPVYPLHIPRGHIPGYVMAGPYYSGPGPAGPPGATFAPPPPDDFADYMWMEHEEEFDKQVMQQLEEEALMEQCIEAMLEDEQRERRNPTTNGHNHNYPTTSNGSSLSLEETVSRSTLNPLAAEFVPTRRAPDQEEKSESPSAPVPAEAPSDDAEPSATHATPTDTHTEESQPEPPEVSAGGDARDKRRPERKKTAHAKSDTKITPKKKEVKAVKSEVKVSDPAPEPRDAHTPAADPTPSPPSEQPLGPKPINYAAAAKANKPKPKATTPPAQPAAPAPDKTEKPKKDKPLPTQKPIQRKNSAK